MASIASVGGCAPELSALCQGCHGGPEVPERHRFGPDERKRGSISSMVQRYREIVSGSKFRKDRLWNQLHETCGQTSTVRMISMQAQFSD